MLRSTGPGIAVRCERAVNEFRTHHNTHFGLMKQLPIRWVRLTTRPWASGWTTWHIWRMRCTCVRVCIRRAACTSCGKKRRRFFHARLTPIQTGKNGVQTVRAGYAEIQLRTFRDRPSADTLDITWMPGFSVIFGYPRARGLLPRRIGSGRP